MNATAITKPKKCPARVRQADVARALKGAIRGGMVVRRVEIDTSGKIVIFSDDREAEDHSALPLDAWRASRGSSAN
jgi:hypothetical protein